MRLGLIEVALPYKDTFLQIWQRCKNKWLFTKALLNNSTCPLTEGGKCRNHNYLIQSLRHYVNFN